MLDKCRKELGSEVENHYLKASTSTNSASIWDSEKKNKWVWATMTGFYTRQSLLETWLLFTLIHTPVSSFTSLTAPTFISSPCKYQYLVNTTGQVGNEQTTNNISTCSDLNYYYWFNYSSWKFPYTKASKYTTLFLYSQDLNKEEFQG